VLIFVVLRVVSDEYCLLGCDAWYFHRHFRQTSTDYKELYHRIDWSLLDVI
jgi:hypothetical protein